LDLHAEGKEMRFDGRLTCKNCKYARFYDYTTETRTTKMCYCTLARVYVKDWQKNECGAFESK
jgi:hypothetical protein